MKKIKWILPLFVTIIILFLGLYMPYFSSLVLDNHLRTQVKQIENNNVSLNLSENIDFFERASLFNRLISEGYFEVELAENSQICDLDANAVKILATEVIASIEAGGTVKGEPEVTPVLLVGTNDESVTQSGVYWRCCWNDTDGESQILWLDDKSSQMVGLMLGCTDLFEQADDYADSSEQTKSYVGSSDENIPETVIKLGNYCYENYKADNLEFQNEGDGIYIITLIREEDELKYPITVYLHNNELLFFNL